MQVTKFSVEPYGDGCAMIISFIRDPFDGEIGPVHEIVRSYAALQRAIKELVPPRHRQTRIRMNENQLDIEEHVTEPISEET